MAYRREINRLSLLNSVLPRCIQRDIIIKYRFPSLSVTVSHRKLKNELRTRDSHELRLSVNPEDDFTDGRDAIPLCLTRRALSLSRLSSCSHTPFLITIFAVGGTTVTFYRCEPLVRSRGIRVAVAARRSPLCSPAYSREKQGFCTRFDSAV